MDVRSNTFVKIGLALLSVIGAALLGATFGPGVILAAFLVGIALLLGRKLRRAPPTKDTNANPASGSTMMPGGLLDVRSNLYGTRRDD